MKTTKMQWTKAPEDVWTKMRAVLTQLFVSCRDREDTSDLAVIAMAGREALLRLDEALASAEEWRARAERAEVDIRVEVLDVNVARLMVNGYGVATWSRSDAVAYADEVARVLRLALKTSKAIAACLEPSGSGFYNLASPEIAASVTLDPAEASEELGLCEPHLLYLPCQLCDDPKPEGGK